MTWIDEMKEAMKMMKSACEKNSSWLNCVDCPFDTYCTYMIHGSIEDINEDIAPCDFKIE